MRDAAGIVPAWAAPATVQAFQTVRGTGPLDGVRDTLGLPSEPCWLEQVHGAGVVRPDIGEQGLVADAAVTDRPGVVLAVRTADCLPVLFADRAGSGVGAAHAGWRGLAAGVLEATVAALGVAPESLVAWFGPAIGQPAFEVGPEVRAAFVDGDPATAACFAAGRGDRWHADLTALARHRLAAVGVTSVFGGVGCTYSEPERFFSYRRDRETGRMAALIWMERR